MPRAIKSIGLVRDNKVEEILNLTTYILHLFVITYVTCFAYEIWYNTAGQFSADNAGRPQGSRNKAALAIRSLLEGQVEVLRETTVKNRRPGEATVSL